MMIDIKYNDDNKIVRSKAMMLAAASTKVENVLVNENFDATRTIMGIF